MLSLPSVLDLFHVMRRLILSCNIKEVENLIYWETKAIRNYF
jgi:uncharacterized protein YprB with RNaseH-like and TPR domain